VDTAHHELGHAVDDMLEPDAGGRPQEFTAHDPRAQELYKSFMDRVAKDPAATGLEQPSRAPTRSCMTTWRRSWRAPPIRGCRNGNRLAPQVAGARCRRLP
jgi:hypothetical protein